MRATLLLLLNLSLTLAEADHDLTIVPGVVEVKSRPKRQGLPIIFPDSIPFEASPSILMTGPGRFAPLPAQQEASEDPALSPEAEPDGILQLPENLDLNTMDSTSLSLVNSIDNITAFAHLFGFQLPPDDDLAPDGLLVSRSALATGKVETAMMAACKPELQTIKLDLPTEIDTIYYPTCVRLKQCGGCCYGPLTCRPKVTKVVKLRVLKTVISTSSSSRVRKDTRERSRRGRRRRGRRQRGRRERRHSQPSYHEVEVIKHEECKCSCRVQEQDCNPAIHNFVENECACVCKSKDEKAKCKQQRDKYWDNDSCACYCHRPLECGSGEYFSQNSCMCERLASRSGFPVEIAEDSIRRMKPIDRPHRRRPVRIPLRTDLDLTSSSRRTSLLNILPHPHPPLLA